jgi:glyoxylate reductase
MKPKVYVTRHLPEIALFELKEKCEVDIWDKEYPPPYETMVDALDDKEGLLCLLTDRVDAKLIKSALRLKVISQCAVGYDNIDVKTAAERGIVVGNTPEVLTDATADFAFGLLMASARRLGEAIDYVRSGHWRTWGLTTLLGHDVFGATLGLIGFGRIGQAVARRARGFNMRILYYDTNRQVEFENEIGAEYSSLDRLLSDSDFVSLHVNLTAATKGLIDATAFKKMKETAILVNTSRGPVVDTEALYEALKQGEIAYAALDVTDPEPLPENHKLLSLSNIIVAPHIASATVSSRTQMAQMAVKNLIAGVYGENLPFPVDIEISREG